MSDPKYIIGIDLGTTHSVLAYTEARIAEDAEPLIRMLSIPQVVSPGEVRGASAVAVVSLFARPP